MAVLTEAKKQKHYHKNSAYRRARILTQGFFLILWFGLFFLSNRYTPTDWSSAFLLFDPLVQFVTISLTGVVVYGLVLPSLLIVLTLFTGRTFCGWICPMGTIIDLYEWIMPGVIRGEVHDKLPSFFRNRHHIKYYILLATIVMALFGYQFLLFLDPLVLLNRSMTAFLYPITTWVAPEINAGITFTVYGATATFAFFITILALNHIHSRFWCRVLCPLGAFLAVISRFSLSGRSAEDCVQCTKCDTQCPQGAIDEGDANKFSKSECIMCMDCDVACPFDINKLSWLNPMNLKWKPEEDIKLDLQRRHFLWTIGGATITIPFVHTHGKSAFSEKTKLRPPHSHADDDRFTSQCIRCWECIKVCPTNILQPDNTSFLDLKNLWTPVMAASAGACMTECNACSEACPTDAIQKYDITQKYDVKVGTAHLIESKCIGYDGTECNDCVVACPTDAIPTTTIVTNEGKSVHVPKTVSYDKCIGCGWCEHVCIDRVPGTPAIIVSAEGRGEIAAVATKNKPKGTEPSRTQKDYLPRWRPESGET
jgi:ferredoxin-type protein NapF